MADDTTFKIFISYAHKDGSDFAADLHDSLESDGFDMWQDARDIRAGKRWDDVIEEALEACSALVFVATERSVESQNCKDELRLMLNLGKPIIPLMVEDVKLYWRIDANQRIDFTDTFDKGIAKLRLELRGMRDNPKKK